MMIIHGIEGGNMKTSRNYAKYVEVDICDK